MENKQFEDLSYEKALEELKRIVKYVTKEEIILPDSKFEDDIIIIAQAMINMEKALQRQIDTDE